MLDRLAMPSRLKGNPATPPNTLMMPMRAESAPLVEHPVHAMSRQIGRQFLLTEREVEVLTLYARGYTQNRIAQELYIAPGTAHSHIKRIYQKTNMHSRQDILDYMEEYC